MMSYFWRAVTKAWLWIYWFGAMLLHAIVFLLGLFVLVLWVLPDVLPRRGPMPLTSPMQIRRKLPRLFREGSDVFLWMPDGTTIPLEPLEVSSLVENVTGVAAGAFVYEKTKLPGCP